jgi:hypothetical protein
VKAAITAPATIDLRTRGQKAADSRAANIAKATQAALQQQQQQQQQQQHQQQQLRQNLLHQQPQQPTINPVYVVQQPQSQPVQQNLYPQLDKTSMRADMALDFNMLEAAVSSYEKFADRRLDKLISTNT